MSQENETQQNLLDPFTRLSLALQTATKDNVKQSYSALVAPSIHGMKYCSLGYARKASGQSDISMFFALEGGIGKRYGFTKEEVRKLHRCPEMDCNCIGTLNHLIAHLNDHHRIPIHIVGKLVMSIKNDTRPVPTRNEKIKSLLYWIKYFLS